MTVYNPEWWNERFQIALDRVSPIFENALRQMVARVDGDVVGVGYPALSEDAFLRMEPAEQIRAAARMMQYPLTAEKGAAFFSIIRENGTLAAALEGLNDA